MEKILITWLSEYVGIPVVETTKFSELNFDLFDEAVTVDFVRRQFGVKIFKEQWFNTVRELIDAVAASA